MKILVTWFAIVVLIIIHEYGHFLAGRLFNVPIAEFSIGFGKVLWQKQGKRETVYSLRAIPMGGYCAFDEDDKSGAVDKALNQLPIAKRFCIFAAGPVFNILTCLLLCLFVSLGTGVPTPTTVVDSVHSGFQAEEVLKNGDKIISVNGTSVTSASELEQLITDVENKDYILGIEREGKELNVNIKPNTYYGGDTYSLGIILQQRNFRLGFKEGVTLSFSMTWSFFTSIFKTLGDLITGAVGVNNMNSIIGATNTISMYASVSQLPMYLFYIALISVNLGVMNLLPIPGLDGFRVCECIVEAITKKRLSEKVEEKLIYGCLALVFGFAGMLMLKDLFFLIMK